MDHTWSFVNFPKSSAKKNKDLVECILCKQMFYAATKRSLYCQSCKIQNEHYSGAHSYNSMALIAMGV